MRAPDKIYINNEAALDLAFNPGEDDSKIEYIRKDALLEWAKEKIRPIANEKDDYSAGKRVAFKQVIEKILSL